MKKILLALTLVFCIAPFAAQAQVVVVVHPHHHHHRHYHHHRHPNLVPNQ